VKREKLTVKQEQVFRFLATHFAKYQRMPTLREPNRLLLLDRVRRFNVVGVPLATAPRKREFRLLKCEPNFLDEDLKQFLLLARSSVAFDKV
jgi:hypothetical protein